MRKEKEKMSQYVNFYFKTKNDTFISIGDFSRNTKMYDVCREVGSPWEQLAPFTEERREAALNHLHYLKHKIREYISELESELKHSHIYQGLNVKERIAWREDIRSEINEWEDEIFQLNYAINFIDIIGKMSEGHDLPHENQLYFGFEVDGALENLKNN